MHTQLNIVPTADGSNTIYNSLVGENYHSRNGALQESRHVFVNAGLQFFLSNKSNGGAEVSILEVGFGTGLNFLLSAEYCIAEHLMLDYTGIEAYPLIPELISQTGYGKYITPRLWDQFLAHYPGGFTLPGASCKLEIAYCKLNDYSSANRYDIIYFDAFAAGTQPEMWDEQAITHTLQFLKPGGVFVTYAITGNLKRIIKSLGLKVEKAPGAAGKREMLRACKPLER